jgi:hypothetical protein
MTTNPTPREYEQHAEATVALCEVLSRLKAERVLPTAGRVLSALEARLVRARDQRKPGTALTPFERMNECRTALERLDTQGWKRSYHQRQFHEDFLVRIFFLF